MKKKCKKCNCNEELQLTVMKLDCSNKFDFCYYGQVNSLWLKSSVVSKWASKHIWVVTFILLAMAQYTYFL